MGLETATYVSDLNTSNPTATDPRAQGDDHLRLIKAAVKATFPTGDRAFRFPAANAVVSANVTVLAPTDENILFPISAAGAARTVTLPTSGLFDGFAFSVVKTDATANTITASAAASINGATDYVLRNTYDLVTFIYSADNSTWYAVSNRLRYVAPSADTAGNYTISGLDHLSTVRITAAAANRTVTLPNTVAAGFMAWVRKTDATAGTVTLDATSGGQINGANTVVLRYQFEEVKIIFDGTTWSAPVYDGEEPGSAKLWFTDTAPTGWAMLEGQAISRTTYPRLFALFSTSYGVGNGTTTFNLPDLRGRFIRAWNHGAGIDPDAASRTVPAGASITAGDHVGTLQSGQNASHFHFIARNDSTGNTTPNATNFLSVGNNYGSDNSYSLAANSGTPDVLKSGLEGGNEARPVNVAVAIIMKLG